MACLSKINSVIGKPIRCDDLTLSMSRVPFARVMIEVNLSNDLPCLTSLSMLDGTIIKQRVIYEYKPRFCSFYCITGHTSNVCQKLHSGVEDTSASGMIKQASDLSSSTDDIGQATGDCCLNPVGVHDYNVINLFDPVAAGHIVLNREVSEKCDTNCRDLSPKLATHHASSGNVITLSDDSSRSDTTRNGKLEISPIAKFTYTTRSKGLPPVLDHGIPSGKSQRKSRLKILVSCSGLGAYVGFDGMLVVFFSNLPGGCWSFLGSFMVFAHDGILGFLVTDYALLWFRLFMLCFMYSRSLFPISIMFSLFVSCCLGLLLVCCWLLLGSAALFLSSVLLGCGSLFP
ncbi:hypothetical protein Peur_004725 [Populus x canadensis]